MATDLFADSSGPKDLLAGVKKDDPGFTAGDYLKGLKKGLLEVPGSLTGLIDIPIAAVTGQKVAGPVAEALGKGTGLEFGKWAKETGETLSPGAQAGLAKLNEAWKGSGADRLGNALLGNFDDLPEAWRNANLRSAGKAILENPGASLMQVVESVPGMAAGGAIGRGVAVAGGVAPWLAGGIGEGAITAGQQMDQTADTVDPRKAALTALAAGLGTGAISAGGGHLAGKLGFDDLQTAMAGGAAGSRTKLLPRIAGGATMEAAQELPQSMQETAWQNFAEDKPLGEGVLRSGVEGAIAGGVMGGVAGLRPRARQAEQAPPPGAPTNAGIADSNAANVELGKALDAYTGAPPLLEEKPIIVQNPTTGNITELDRRAGPLEAAAAQAVESGLTSIAQNVNAGEVLQPFQNLQAAQGYVQMQTDPEMFDVIPHPRVAGTQAVVPKTGADRQAILDKRTAAGANQAAEIRAAQLEQEEAPNETGITEKIKGRFGDGGEGTVTLTPRNDGGFEVSVVSQTGPAKRTSRAGFAGGVSKAEAIKQATAAHGGFTSEKEAPAEPKPEVDTAVEDATQDELAPQPVQKVTDMPGVQQQAKAQAGEAVSKARVRAEQLAAEENPETVDAQAQAANPAPTDAQKSAGNYAKGHLSIGGLNISVETPAGATRTGRDGAKPWKVKNTAHYGYVKRTNGADGEQVDVYVKPGTAATHDGQVFVVDQYHPGTGAFDEHKAMIGYGNAAEAAKAYDAHFSDQSGAKRRGAVTAMPLGGFKTWLKNGDTMRPVSSRKFDGQASDPAQEAQDEIAQSTGARFSRQRKGEPDTDYLQRQVKEAEAALAASKKGRRKGESRDAYLQRRVEEARAKLSAASVTPPLPRTRREGESDTDYLRRRADEANAAKDARQTPPAKAFPTKARDEAAVREALGLENDAGVSILSPESRPDAGQARGVSKQAAQFIVQAARLFGKRVVFFDVPDPNAAEGIYAQDNTIYLNVNSSTQHLRVLGHELTHAMKNQAGEAYEKMLGAVAALRTDAEMVAQYKDYFNEDLDNPARLDQPHPGTQGTLREFLAEEWMADLGGNRFAESDFWTAVFAQLETQHGAPAAQGIIARLRAALVTALNKLKGLIGGNAFAVDARLAEHLEDIRVAVAQGFAEYARRSKAGALSGGSGQGTKFSPQKETTQTAFVEAVPSERTRAGLAAGALSGAQKSAFTQYVFGKVDPAKVARGVLGRIDVRVEVLASTEGYQPDGAESGRISPNVLVQVTPIGKRAVTLEEAVRVAQALNYVYTQDGVPVSRYDDQLLDMPADTPNVTHIVRFTLPGLQEGHTVSAQEEAFYRHLEKVYGVGIGYSKIDGKIVVGNYAGLAHEEFHRLTAEVAQAAGIEYEFTAAEGDYVFHDWENDGQGTGHQIWGNADTARRPNLQARLHDWRDGAVQAAAGWLDERGIRYSPNRSADTTGGRYVGPESGRADSGPGRPIHDRRGPEGRVDLVGVHFSKEPRTWLSGVYFGKGTGAQSQETERVRSATDERIKSRIYAYVNEGKGVFPEDDVGRHAHAVKFDNLYDLGADPLDIKPKFPVRVPADANPRESAILDAGFDGYYARGAFGNQGVAILMGKAATRGIAPDYRGKELEVPPVGEPSEFGKQQQAITANRGLPDGEMTGADWKRLMPRLMPDIDVSHLDDAKKYYKNEIAQRPAKLSPARLAMQWESQTTNEVGPVYRGKGFGLRAVRKFDTETDFLEQDALPWGHAAFVRDPAYRFAVVDQTGAPVGFLDAEVNGLDEINAIHDMAIERPGEGLGAKVVETIMASTYDGVRVIDVLPQSERFWDRLGAGNYDLYKNTTLDFEGSPAEARFRHARSAGIRGAATAGTGENRRREARFSSARGAPTVTGVGYTTDHVESEGLPLFSLRRALNGEHNTDDHLVPETPLYLDNPNLVDLAYANGKPIRLNVGLDLGSGRGRGALHLIGSAAREGNRSLDQITDDEGENVVQTVIRVLGSGSAMLHWQEGKRYALRVPMANKTLIMQNDRNHYSIVTMLPSAANKWGTAEWTGRLTFPAPTAATTADPLAPAPAESSQAGLKGIGYSSEKFHTKPPVPAAQAPIVVRVAQKRHRTLDLAAMAADGLAVKKSLPRGINVDGIERPTTNSKPIAQDEYGRPRVGAPVHFSLARLDALRQVKAGDAVDGRIVRERIPNTDSISASLEDYTVKGVREVPMSMFDASYIESITEKNVDARTLDLVEQIAESGELNPLIVAVDSKGAYIIEGGHRFDALILSRAESIPALLVVDDSDPPAQDAVFSAPRSTLGDLTPEQEAAANHVLGAPKTRMQRLAEFKKDWAQNLKQGIFDQFAPIAELDQNAYILARLSKGGESSLEALMLYGKLFVGADGATDVHYTKAGKPQGFASKISELKGEHDRFFLWVAAQRADRLKAIGLENLFSKDDIKVLIKLNEGTMKDGTAREPLFKQALQDLNDFNDNVLEVAVASGLIDDQTRQMYRNTPYIPFYRLQEDDEVSGFGIKPGLVNQYAWKKLKGGTEQLNQDLMANLLHNWSHLITASARNRAAKATLDAAEKAGIAQQVASSLGQYVANKTTMLPPGTKGQVSYKEGSVEKSFVISDPHLMDAVAALHYAGLGPWAKPLSTAKHWLTVGVTANPAFKLRNLIRDTIGALGTAQLSYRADQNLVQGWRATAEDSETRAHLLASGGMIRFGSMLDGKDSQRAQDLIKAGVDPNMILDSDAKIRRFWKRFVSPALTAYNELGDRTEQVNRAALYEQLIAKGLTHAEAAYWARDLMDFSMSGKWTAIRTLTQTVPFFNARLQGLYKLGRAGKQDIRRLGTVLGAVTLASLALLLAYQDDDDWKKRWDSDRNNYWWFKVGGHAFRLPKPFEIGAVGTLAERSYEVAFNSEMTGDRFGKNLRDIVMSQLSMNPVPQLFKPMMDLYANRDSFTGQAIESMGMERLRKQDRFDERTSETAKFLGSLGLPDLTQFVMGRWDTLSPRQIDFLAKGYFSWLATMATTVIDFGIRPMINAGDRPDPQLKDVFFVGNFVESLPSNSSRYLTQMYDQAREIEQAYASYHARLKVGDVEGAKKILAEDGDLIRRQKATEALKRQEGLLNARLQFINASTTLTGEEKRIRLDQVYARRNAIAEQFRAL